MTTEKVNNLYDKLNQIQYDICDLENLSEALKSSMNYCINNSEKTEYLITLIELICSKISSLNNEQQLMLIDFYDINFKQN